MRLLGFTGNLLLGLFGLAMGAFYLFLMHDWSGDFGPGMPTVIGVGVLAGLWLIGAAMRFRKGFQMVAPQTSTAGRSTAKAVDDDPVGDRGGFDPDAALARYLASKGAEPSRSHLVDAPRGFGRRGL